MRRRAAAIAFVAALATGLAGCTADAPAPGPTPARSASISATTASLERALPELPRRTLTPAEPMRLAKGLLPPTNRWFSGLVFGKAPQPVFPSPLAVTPASSGPVVTLPTVTTSADTIAGPAAGGLAMNLGATGMTVTRYDDLTVTMTYTDGAGPLADVTLAQGWPYVAITARRALAVAPGAPLTTASSGLWRTTASGTRYDIRAPRATDDSGRLRLRRGVTAVVFAVPAGVDEALLVRGARGVVEGGTATGSLTAKTATTTLRYRTADAAPTVLAARPSTSPRGANCTEQRVLTIYGRSPFCVGTALATTVPRLEAADTLGLDRASAAERRVIGVALHRDLAATPAEPPDTYAGGKWLYRVANLLQLARALGADADAATARGLLDASLQRWTEPDGCTTRPDHCMVYDPVLRGVVGHQASYGSDQFNDHHFHYGYFLYAAAVALMDRPALRARIAPVIDLLAADIGSPTSSASLPEYRVFDAYAGHSWAAGFAPFADGNDEESSSEAVNAWNGLALWAKASGRAGLEQRATWLLSTEAASARRDWLEPDLTAFPAFQHRFVSLNWGGKRDSATWFSADPAAKLGIQLIPMSPVAEYLQGDAAAATRNLAEARAGGTGLFADYLLMYESLGRQGTGALLGTAARLKSTSIDTASSVAYLTAWIATRSPSRGSQALK